MGTTLREFIVESCLATQVGPTVLFLNLWHDLLTMCRCALAGCTRQNSGYAVLQEKISK